jgi:hypothetical protein
LETDACATIWHWSASHWSVSKGPIINSFKGIAPIYVYAIFLFLLVWLVYCVLYYIFQTDIYHYYMHYVHALVPVFMLFKIFLLAFQEPTRFFFRNNSATFFGSLFSVNSLHFCDIGYFVPSNVTNLVSLFQSNNVVEYTDSPLQSGLSTAPSFIVFYGSSSQCYKTAGNITYLLPNCSHQLLKGM